MFVTRADSITSSYESLGVRLREHGLQFLAVTVQLALVLFAIRIFQLEDGFGFQRLLPVIFGGFVVHAWLPMPLRLPFFVSLTLVSVWLLFGLIPGSWLIGIGLGLIGLCHLPVAKWIRVTLVVLASLALIALRAAWVQTSWSPSIIAILGSMFMFRLALYLYDMDNEKKKATLWERLAYFFMLPNTVFPFFPIVDYINFRRSYYDKDAITIYQKGVLWMLRGAIHLILYRLVYYYFTPAVEEITTLAGVVLFIVSAYLLYLRVSGLFHLIIGILCLFGFNLPETHKQYFLAHSFNDYWRRINIYWKDFMMKMFFYPLYMKMRHWGATTALVVSTLLVFFFTWLLHSYQWFWLQGDFPLTTVDGVYWMVLGVLVAINSVWETKAGKKKRLSVQGFDARAVLKLTLKTVVTFVFLALMWSFWSSESVGEWWTVMGASGGSGAMAWVWILVGLAGLFVVLVGKEWLESKGLHVFFDERKMSFQSVAGRTSAMALGVVLLGMPQVQGRLGGEAETVLASLQETRLNARDQAQLERGYYENLLANDNYTSGLFGAQPQKPADWVGIYETDAVSHRTDERLWELRPDMDITFKGVRMRTNRWGMRDRDYSMEKPAGAYRMAVMGASYVMGAGVADHESFEEVVEERLNAETGASSHAMYELLNFSVGGYGLVQQVVVAHEQVFDFEPDAVLYVVQPEETRRTIERLLPALLDGHGIQSPYLREALNRIGYEPQMDRPELRKRLYSIGEELVEWGYGEIARLSKEHNAVPVLVILPNTARAFRDEEITYLTGLAEKLGFEVLNLQGVYEGHSLEEIRIASWDLHPNALGHKLIADRLYGLIKQSLDIGH